MRVGWYIALFGWVMVGVMVAIVVGAMIDDGDEDEDE